MLCSNCEKLGLRPERFQCTGDTELTELEPFCHKVKRRIWRNGSCQLCGLIHKSITAPLDDTMKILLLPLWAQENRAAIWIFHVLLGILAIIRSVYHYQTEFTIEWVMDGRFKWVKNGRKPKRTEDYDPISRRRRIRISWGRSNQVSGPPKNEREELYLLYVPSRDLEDPKTGLNKLSNEETSFLARDSNDDIHAWIKSWIKLCEKNHGNAFTPVEVKHGKAFLNLVRETWFCVVDVKDMCLTDLELKEDKPESFVALSYVWGKDPDKSHWTLRSNIMKRKETGGLQMNELPRTIQDAIRLVQNLGHRYIWIDSLCVMQDSLISWKRNAEKMDLIFGNAYFTICAADGDACTGLMALDHQRRNAPKKEKVKKNLELLVSNSPESVIQRSRWSTRGWTFQERILSRRCLVFAEGRIYLQCRESNYDDSSMNWSSDRRKSPLHMVNDLEERPIWFYMTCLELYTGRSLTRPADILEAFNGVSRVLEDHLCAPFFFGLPSSHFDLALLWRPKSGKKRRQVKDSAVDREKDAEFPSWSWSGWQDSNPAKSSAVYYPDDILEGCLNNLQDWLLHHTWIVWYIRDSNGDIEPLWQGYTEKYTERNKDRDAQWNGYGNKWDSAIPEGKNDVYAYGRKGLHFTNIEPPLRRTDFDCALPDNAFGARISRKQKKSYQPILQFWTWKCRFYVVINQDSPGLGAGLARMDVLDQHRDWCGTVVVDKSWAKDHKDKDRCHFIALSDARKFTDFECTSWTYTIPKSLEDIDWNLYHVMLIERPEDSFVWERKGLGKVLKVVFETREDSKWEEIMLG